MQTHVLSIRQEATIRNVSCFGVSCTCGWVGVRRATRGLATSQGETHRAIALDHQIDLGSAESFELRT